MSKEVRLRVLYILAVAAGFGLLISPFLIPIFFAATVALTLSPIQRWLMFKGWSGPWAAGILTFLFAVFISIPAAFFVVKGTNAVVAQLERVSFHDRAAADGVKDIVKDLRHDILRGIQKYSGKHTFLRFLDEEMINKYLTLASSYLLHFFKNFLASLPSMFVMLIITLLCTYSFLIHLTRLRTFFQSLLGFSDELMDELSAIFVNDSRQIYFSNITTGAIQSLIVSTSAALLGLADFFVVFFITLIFSFIPVIGAAPVAFIAALVSFFLDNTTGAIVLAVVGVFTGTIDNILRPWLARWGGTSKIPPIISFICVIGGAILLGFPGLFIGLLLGAIAYDTLPIFWHELGHEKRLHFREDHFPH